MAVLKYRDPGSGQFVELGATGPAGSPGPVGDPGPVAVSADAGNVARIGSDGGIFVALTSNPLTRAEADARYLAVAGGTMTGSLTVRAPTAGEHVSTKTYIDNLKNSGSTVWVQATVPTTPSTGDIWLRT